LVDRNIPLRIAEAFWGLSHASIHRRRASPSFGEAGKELVLLGPEAFNIATPVNNRKPNAIAIARRQHSR
jgi:hypothetical protein